MLRIGAAAAAIFLEHKRERSAIGTFTFMNRRFPAGALDVGVLGLANQRIEEVKIYRNYKHTLSTVRTSRDTFAIEMREDGLWISRWTPDREGRYDLVRRHPVPGGEHPSMHGLFRALSKEGAGGRDYWRTGNNCVLIAHFVFAWVQGTTAWDPYVWYWKVMRPGGLGTVMAILFLAVFAMK
jgi:hypothetical protein